MNRTKVESSNVVSIGYDPAQQVLEVEFKGAVYQYLAVTAEEHAALMASNSKGQHLNAHIKPNHMFRKVENVVVD